MKSARNALFLQNCLGLGKIDRTCHINATDTNPATGKAYAVRPDGIWDDNYFASNFGGASGGGGANTAAYDDLLNKVPKATDFAAGLNTKEDSAVNDLFGYLNTQDSPLDFYTKISEAQGIPGLRKTQSTLQGQIYDLEDTLRRIEPNVTATTGQSLVTEAQRQGMVTEKQKPIIENLGWQSQSLGRVSGAITEANNQAVTLTGLNQQGQDRFIDAYKTKLDVAMSQGSRALQAFISDSDKIVTVTLAKIARGEKVSDQEAANAFELLKMQKQADLNIKTEDAKSSTEITEAGGRKLLVDKKTGKTIADLGSSKSASDAAVANISSYYPTGTAAAATGGFKPFTSILDYNNYLNGQ